MNILSGKGQSFFDCDLPNNQKGICLANIAEVVQARVSSERRFLVNILVGYLYVAKAWLLFLFLFKGKHIRLF